LAVAGWLATTWLAYRWGLHSQKLQIKHAEKTSREDRSRSFLVFLAGRKQEISGVEYHVQPLSFGLRYTSFKIDFRERATQIQGDIPESGKKKFSELVNAIVGLKNETAGTDEGIKRTLELIGETEIFIREIRA
jgi:hypothetical protein